MDGRLQTDLATLARCVGDVAVFADHHWGRAPLLRRDAKRFDDLLDLAAIDRLLGTMARPPSFRVVREGETLPVDHTTRTVRLAGRDVEQVADLGLIAEQLAAGATLVLQGLQRTWLPIARFCRSLERATSHAVQANAYLSPAGTKGLSRHVDTHDVIVLQLWGAKSWEIDGLGEVELSMGDVLYLPTGTGHAAATSESPSLHLTIGVLRDTYRTVVERALSAVDLDGPLPLGYAHELGRRQLEAGVVERLGAVTMALPAIDIDAVTAEAAERSQRRRRPLLTGQIRSVMALADINDDTWLRRRIDNVAVLTADGDGLRLELFDRAIHLPVGARRALEVVLAERELAVHDLVGLDQASRTVLARRLVREGLLEIVAAVGADRI